MQLTKEETRRAISLQRRIKLVRAWKSLGKLFIWPWTIFDKIEQKWHDELIIYYNKKFVDVPKQPIQSRPVTQAEYDEAMREYDELSKVLNKWTSLGDIHG